MKWTDVCGGMMTAEQIGREINYYLNSCNEPSKLMVTIKRQNDKFYTKIYMLVEDFDQIGCNHSGELCPKCRNLLSNILGGSYETKKEKKGS